MSLTVLLQELGETLLSSDDSSSIDGDDAQLQQQAVCRRVEAVLMAVLQHCKDTSTVRGRELGVVLKLVKVALQRYPGHFGGARGPAGVHLLGSLLGLCVQPPCSSVSGELRSACEALLALMLHRAHLVFARVVRGVWELLEDLYQVLQVAQLSPGGAQCLLFPLRVSCLEHALDPACYHNCPGGEEAAEAAAAAAGGTDERQKQQVGIDLQGGERGGPEHGAGSEAAAPMELCIGSADECRTLAAHVLQLASACMRMAPSLAAGAAEDGMHLRMLLSGLMAGGGLPQVAAASAQVLSLLLAQQQPTPVELASVLGAAQAAAATAAAAAAQQHQQYDAAGAVASSEDANSRREGLLDSLTCLCSAAWARISAGGGGLSGCCLLQLDALLQCLLQQQLDCAPWLARPLLLLYADLCRACPPACLSLRQLLALIALPPGKQHAIEGVALVLRAACTAVATRQPPCQASTAEHAGLISSACRGHLQAAVPGAGRALAAALGEAQMAQATAAGNGQPEGSARKRRRLSLPKTPPTPMHGAAGHAEVAATGEQHTAKFAAGTHNTQRPSDSGCQLGMVQLMEQVADVAAELGPPRGGACSASGSSSSSSPSSTLQQVLALVCGAGWLGCPQALAVLGGLAAEWLAWWLDDSGGGGTGGTQQQRHADPEVGALLLATIAALQAHMQRVAASLVSREGPASASLHRVRRHLAQHLLAPLWQRSDASFRWPWLAHPQADAAAGGGTISWAKMCALMAAGLTCGAHHHHQQQQQQAERSRKLLHQLMSDCAADPCPAVRAMLAATLPHLTAHAAGASREAGSDGSVAAGGLEASLQLLGKVAGGRKQQGGEEEPVLHAVLVGLCGFHSHAVLRVHHGVGGVDCALSTHRALWAACTVHPPEHPALSPFWAVVAPDAWPMDEQAAGVGTCPNADADYSSQQAARTAAGVLGRLLLGTERKEQLSPALQGNAWAVALEYLPAMCSARAADYCPIAQGCLDALADMHAFVRNSAAGGSRLLAHDSVLAALYPGEVPGDGGHKDWANTAQFKLLQSFKALLDGARQAGGSLRESLLAALASTGAACSGDNARLMLMAVLVGHLADADLGVAAAAAELLQAVADEEDVTLRELVLSSGKLLEYIGRNIIAKETLLGDICELLEEPPSDLVPHLLPHALPRLVLDADTAALEALARHCPQHRTGVGNGAAAAAGPLLFTPATAQSLIQDNGHLVVAKLLYEGTDADTFDRVLSFMEGLLGANYISHLQGHHSAMQRVIMQVFDTASRSREWGAGPSVPDAVVTRVKRMVRELKPIAGVGEDVGEEDFLAGADHVTRILKQYGDRLVKPGGGGGPAGGGGAGAGLGAAGGAADTATHVAALRGVMLLAQLTKGHVVQFLPQMMVLFSSCLQPGRPTPVRLHAVQGWRTLVGVLATHDQEQLRTNANRVVVALLECLQQQQQQGNGGGSSSSGEAAVCEAAAGVIELLVVTNRPLLEGYLAHIPPLPQGASPQLHAANQVLAGARGKLSAREQADLLVQLLGHHSLHVRCTALQELRDLLSRQRDWLVELLQRGAVRESSNTKTPHARLLSRLMAALLRCCDPEGQRTATGLQAQRLCAQCLGLLGAVDPARVDVALDAAQPRCGSGLDLLVDVVQLHLVRILRAALDLGTLEMATFAIQELLRLAPQLPAEQQALSTPPATRREGASQRDIGNPLYDALPDDTRAVVRPYLDSKYELRGSRARPVPGAVFGSGSLAGGSSFRRWLYTWMKQLVDNHATGTCAVVLEACLPVARRDMSLALFLLPYLVHNVVGRGSGEARAQVAAELRAVLTQGPSSKEGELCVQALFSLLSVLRAWHAREEEGTAAAASSGGDNGSGSGARVRSTITRAPPATEVEGKDQLERVSALLDAIPYDVLASAAFRVGAHARALMYYESHVRRKYGGGLNPPSRRSVRYDDRSVSFLQAVYSRLEEPDGLAGLTRLRLGGPAAADRILAAEKAGMWSEALALYQQDPAMTQHQQQGQALQHGQRAVGDATQQAAAAAAGGEEREEVGAGSSSSSSLMHAALSHRTARQGTLLCLLQLGQLQSAVRLVDGWLAREPEEYPQLVRELAPHGMAAAWRLGDWGLVEEYRGAWRDVCELSSSTAGRMDQEANWEVHLGGLVCVLARRDFASLEVQLAAARDEVMQPLCAATMESYPRAYPSLVKLHMLQELADVAAMMQAPTIPSRGERQRRLRWDIRLGASQPALCVQEPILSLRRQLSTCLGEPRDAGDCWLQHARLCRTTGHFESAASAGLQAVGMGVLGAGLEHAQLLWDTEQPHRAIMELEQTMQQLERGVHPQDAQPSELQQYEARVKLRMAGWKAETGQGRKDDIRGLFEAAIGLQKRWERGYFEYATYLDQVMRDAKQRQQAKQQEQAGRPRGLDRLGGRSRIPLGEDQPYVELLPEVLRQYACSVQHGCAHLYQSLPRLLTLWYEFGDAMATSPRTLTSKERAAVSAVANLMAAAAKKLPPAVWLLALPQLISRVGHRDADVSNLTRSIITSVAVAYPQQALWALAVLNRSSVPARRSAAEIILTHAKRQAPEHSKRLLQGFGPLCDQLIRLCHHSPASKAKAFSCKREFSTLVRMLPSSGAVVPLTATLSVALPPSGAAVGGPDHQPFSESITIEGIKDEVAVLHSLQKPKKITLLGSDGCEYAFLAKPKDDLRKDNRMMEVAGVLNKLFTEDPASRRRGLYLRRFAVVPLTEDCGLIEWVPNTTGLRHCCQDTYSAEKGYDFRHTNTLIRKMYDGFQGTRRTELLDSVLDLFPPVLHKWLLQRFPEPAAWLNARSAFTRTAAVWSMVGHMMGLGDRHGENILVDASSGDIVHVDFSCLFDKGLTLEKPEMVPFRLTQNLVDVFGVAGVEGAFRRAAEITLQVLREHRETLLSVLETFVHDPLVEWARGGRAEPEADNPQAKDAMITIEGRLTGTLIGVSSTPSLQLSVEGHAQHLIAEAIDKENLGLMYIWWMPWF